MKSFFSKLLVITSLFVLAGCVGGIKDGPITVGDNVWISYTAVFAQEQNKIFERQEEPMKIKVGKGDLHQIIDQHLLGLEKGQIKVIKIPSYEGFGEEYDQSLAKVLPAAYFALGDKQVEMGQIVNIDGREGEVIGIQGEGTEQLVTIDLNPAHTWKDLEYIIKIEQVGGKEFVAESEQAQ